MFTALPYDFLFEILKLQSINKHTGKQDYKLKKFNIQNTALRTRPCLCLQQGNAKIITKKYIDN